MKFFLKLLWYKFYRFLEKIAVKPKSKSFDDYQMKKLNASNGILLSVLFLFFNSMVIYFIIAEVLDFGLSDSSIRIMTLAYMGILIFIGNRIIMRNDNFKEIEKEISNSKYKGIFGNLIIAIYIILSFISMIGLIQFFICKP